MAVVVNMLVGARFCYSPSMDMLRRRENPRCHSAYPRPKRATTVVRAEASEAINPSIRKEEAKVVDSVLVAELSKPLTAYCRCWRSGTFPLCDGSHVKHNEAAGDNVGPLLASVARDMASNVFGDPITDSTLERMPASNVFGDPITNSTLERMPEYEITRKDRAHVALNMKNAGEKYANARQYVENLKARWGTGVSTLCLVYNATGDPITFARQYDWYGHIEPDAPYPQEIANGQWGGYLHVKTSKAPSGSSAAVVYRGKNEAGDGCDWMLAWSNPLNTVLYNNKAYTEIHEADHYKQDVWSVVYEKLCNSDLEHSDEWNGCLSTVTTGSDTSPIFEAILTLKNAA